MLIVRSLFEEEGEDVNTLLETISLQKKIIDKLKRVVVKKDYTISLLKNIIELKDSKS